MLDPKLIREQPELVKQAARVKRIGSPELVDQWLAADEKRRSAQTQADALKAEQNKLGQQVGKLKRELKGGTSAELEAVLAQSNEIKSKQQAAADEQVQAEARASEIMLQLPAIPDPNWPVGKDDTENVEMRKWADPERRPLP